MNIHLHSICLALLLGATGIPCPISARAQEVPASRIPVWLTKSIVLQNQEWSFNSVVGELSKRTQRAFLTDGEPIVDKVTEGYAGTVKEVLDRVADRFDFTWSVNGRGAVLWNKRFHNPEERPQVHLSEMQRMSKDAVSVFAALRFDPSVGHTALIQNQVYHALLPEHRDAMLAGAHLRLADLTPEESASVEQAILNHDLASLFSQISVLNQCLAGTPRGTLYTELTQMNNGDPKRAPVPYYTVRFLYATGDGRDIPSVVVAQNRSAPAK